MFKIDAASLHRVLYNSLLFDTKSAKAFEVVDGFLKMNTSDGQVYLEDIVQLADEYYTENHVWIWDAQHLKAMSKGMEKIDGQLEVDVKPGSETIIIGLPDDSARIGGGISYGEYAQQSSLFDAKGHENGSLTFSINPDRLRKLSLLQPKDYPVEIMVRQVDGIKTDVLLFRKGPTVRGAYATLSLLS